MGIDEQLPTIAVVAHYDAFGIAPVRKLLTRSECEDLLLNFILYM